MVGCDRRCPSGLPCGRRRLRCLDEQLVADALVGDLSCPAKWRIAGGRSIHRPAGDRRGALRVTGIIHGVIATVRPAHKLEGAITVPGDKSISHRALILGAIASGDSHVRGLSLGADVQSTVQCLRALGVEIHDATIAGRGMQGLRAAATPLDCGNSGTTMRLLAGLLAAQEFESELTGDDSLSRRPMDRVVQPLLRMGARASWPPLRVGGQPKLEGTEYVAPAPSAQVKSAILLAGLYAAGETAVVEPAGELRPVGVEGGMAAGMIDELPVLAVAATQIAGKSVIAGAGELRVKESNRLAAMEAGLAAMGADIVTQDDGWVITGPRRLEGARVDSAGDHRIAMALAVAGLIADGKTDIEGAECVEISYAGFFDHLEYLC